MTLWAVLPVKRLEKGKSRLRPCLGSEELFMLNWTQFLSTFEKLVNCPEIDKVLGLELGADDYLAKPYEPRELVLRIESILKRNLTKSFKIGDFTIDKDNRTVLIDDYAIDFTKIEFEIFIYLIENKNKISSREQILNATSLDFNTKNRTIDMHISNIRAKIGDDSKNPKYIKSVWGIGYKFVG